MGEAQQNLLYTVCYLVGDTPTTREIWYKEDNQRRTRCEWFVTGTEGQTKAVRTFESGSPRPSGRLDRVIEIERWLRIGRKHLRREY